MATPRRSFATRDRGYNDTAGSLTRLARSDHLEVRRLAERGELDDADAYIARALELDPELGTAWAWRGRARELGGDIEEADANWAEAEALLGDDDPLRAVVAAWRRQSG